jgi:hypothetical protein
VPVVPKKRDVLRRAFANMSALSAIISTDTIYSDIHLSDLVYMTAFLVICLYTVNCRTRSLVTIKDGP